MKLVRLTLLVLGLILLVGVGRYFLLKRDPVASTADLPSKIQSTEPAMVSASVSPTGTPASINARISLNAHEVEQIQVLAEILKSKNDNDSRMDQVLKNLSEPVKLALQNQYSEMKMELRNERGTIAFLIGREIKEGRGSLTDVEFLKNVLLEKPCMSLMDCSKPSTSESIEEQHLEGIHETTAHYPQLMDLRYLKQSLESGNLSPEMKASVLAALGAAKNSPNPRVVLEAQAILDSVSEVH